MTRDYGKVRAQFWDDESLRELSIEANYLALYLITSRHTNAIGCFRLPIAYILNDTRLDKKALEKALAELRSVGYAIPCERLPWIYIPNFLRHNPPENPNVWRKCVKELETVPAGVVAIGHIAKELLAVSYDERMCRDGAKGRVSEEERNKLKRFGDGFETVSEGLLPSPSPIPIPEPNQSISPTSCARSKPPKGDFDQFWDSVPRKLGKGKARKAYLKALTKTAHETILAGIRRYAATRAGQPEEYTKHPATWLNDECWLDEAGTGPPVSAEVISIRSAFQSPEELEGQRRMLEKLHGKTAN